jgi:hypothetical protein
VTDRPREEGKADKQLPLSNLDYQIRRIGKTDLARADGTLAPFGAWLVQGITTDTIEAFRAVRGRAGLVAASRDLALLRGAVQLGDVEASKTRRRENVPRRLESGREAPAGTCAAPASAARRGRAAGGRWVKFSHPDQFQSGLFEKSSGPVLR